MRPSTLWCSECGESECGECIKVWRNAIYKYCVCEISDNIYDTIWLSNIILWDFKYSCKC